MLTQRRKKKSKIVRAVQWREKEHHSVLEVLNLLLAMLLTLAVFQFEISPLNLEAEENAVGALPQCS